MLVRKGGITRQIDDKRLQEYKDKGFEPVAAKEARQPKEPDSKAPTEK